MPSSFHPVWETWVCIRVHLTLPSMSEWGIPVGASLAGRLSDRVVVAWRKRRGPDVWVPEDRLRACLWGAGLFVPMSVLLSGLTTQFVPGTLGIVLNLVWLFMNSIGVRAYVDPEEGRLTDSSVATRTGRSISFSPRPSPTISTYGTRAARRRRLPAGKHRLTSLSPSLLTSLRSGHSAV